MFHQTFKHKIWHFNVFKWPAVKILYIMLAAVKILYIVLAAAKILYIVLAAVKIHMLRV